MVSPHGFAGIHAILYALFDADERLDRQAMRRQVELCLAAGVHGIGALGLATEVAKLSEAERRTVMEWMAEDTAGRVPLFFTIFGASVAEQTAQVRQAEAVGADWVILQPPPVGSYGAAEYIQFFGRVAGATHLPTGIQNAPAFLGRGLTADEISRLVRDHSNIRVLKAEGAAVEIERVIAATGGSVPVLNGRGGLEVIDNLRAGCAGLILPTSSTMRSSPTIASAPATRPGRNRPTPASCPPRASRCSPSRVWCATESECLPCGLASRSTIAHRR